jgi:DNA-binding NtrC family response regulator
MTSANPAHPILIIDDEESILLAIDTTLQLAGMNNLLTCGDSRQAMAMIEQHNPSVVLLDLNMPHVNGESIQEKILATYPHVPVIIITGRIDAETAVQCMKNGAFDYLVKPVDEERLVTVVGKSLQYREAHSSTFSGLPASRDALSHPQVFATMCTISPKMLRLFAYAESVAGTGHPVLICGETGTGKELMAKAIHQLSACSGEFVAVNVAGLDDNVFTDTLFGHARGAFTGAEESRPGLIERAAGGTLFLDEIGDLSPGVQIKLLRLLQEKEYLPLGLDRPRLSTARIVASTHVDLWERQHRELFRQDLHYRLRTHMIHLPSLRERREDIPLLVEHFAVTASESLKKPRPLISRDLLAVLDAYHFPGNIRELQAMVLDAMAQHCGGSLSLIPFRHHIWQVSSAEKGEMVAGGHQSGFSGPLPTLKENTRKLIDEAMARAGNNQTAAAALLGITQQALSKRLKNRHHDR